MRTFSASVSFSIGGMVNTRLSGNSGKAIHDVSSLQSKGKTLRADSGGGFLFHVPQDSLMLAKSEARIFPRKPRPSIPMGDTETDFVIPLLVRPDVCEEFEVIS